MAQNFPKGLPSFYTKLYKIVDDPSLDPIISWSESKNAFIVWDLKGLCREILPKYVGLARNYAHFVSELRYHGFERVVGTGQFEYGHDDFVRGQPHRLKKMVLQVWTERMERIGANLEAKIARTKAKIARASARKDRVQVESLLQGLRI